MGGKGKGLTKKRFIKKNVHPSLPMRFSQGVNIKTIYSSFNNSIPR